MQGLADVAGQRPDVSTFAAYHPDDDFRQFERNSSSSSMTKVLAFSSTSSPLRAKSYARLPFTLQAEKTGGTCSIVPTKRTSVSSTISRVICSVGYSASTGFSRSNEGVVAPRRSVATYSFVWAEVPLSASLPYRCRRAGHRWPKDRAYRHVPLSVSSLPISCTTGNVPWPPTRTTSTRMACQKPIFLLS